LPQDLGEALMSGLADNEVCFDPIPASPPFYGRLDFKREKTMLITPELIQPVAVIELNIRETANSGFNAQQEGQRFTSKTLN
jgi:hypothetical protein